jgi:hypothetical protein
VLLDMRTPAAPALYQSALCGDALPSWVCPLSPFCRYATHSDLSNLGSPRLRNHLRKAPVQSITSPAHIPCTKHYIPCTHQSIRVLELIVCLLQLLKGLSCCRSRVFVWMHKDGQLPVCSAELATADCPSGLAHFIQLRSWQLQQPALRTMRHNTNVP